MQDLEFIKSKLYDMYMSSTTYRFALSGEPVVVIDGSFWNKVEDFFDNLKEK